MSYKTQPPRDWESPDWDSGSRVHNWHNHVPDYVANLWPSLSEEQKKAISMWADELAGNEHWD